MIHVTSVTLCPLVARVTYVTQKFFTKNTQRDPCDPVTQKQNFPEKNNVTHVTSATL